jgi:phage-related minor tail protein
MKEIIIPILAGIGGIMVVVIFFFAIVYRLWKWSDEEPQTPHEQMKDFWDERQKRFDNFTS